MEQDYSPDAKAWSLLITLSILWGSAFILASKSLELFSPYIVTCLRMLFAAIVLSFYFFPHFRKIPREKWIYIIITGYMGFLAPFLLYVIGQTHIKSSIAGVLMSLNPALTFLIAVIIFKMEWKITQLSGVLIGLAGCMIIGFVGGSGGFGGFNFFILYLIAAMIMFSFSVNIIKAKLSDVDPVLIAAASMVVIAPACLLYLFSSDFPAIMAAHPDGWEHLGYTALLGAFATGIPYIMYFKVIIISNVVFASTANYYTSLVALILGIFFGEKIYPLDFMGIILILVGVLIVGYKRKHHHFLHRI